MTWTADRRRLIKRLVRDVVESPEVPEAYRDAARETGALPVYCDVGGCLAITPGGEIVEFNAENHSVRPVRDPAWRRRALVRAARRYQELEGLRPEKPAHAVWCTVCRGRGVAVDDLDCAECDGLGWKA